jgi:hypothetical protein
MGHERESQEEENTFFKGRIKKPADFGRLFVNFDLDLPALVLDEVRYDGNVNVFSLIGLDAPVNVEQEAK